MIEDTEGEGLRGNGSPLKSDCADNKAQHDPQSHKRVNKDLLKVTSLWATSQPGNKTPNTAKIGEAKSSLGQNSSKTSGEAFKASAVTSKMDTSSQKSKIHFPSKIHITIPEMITSPPRLSPPPLEMTPAKPKTSSHPQKTEVCTPSPKTVTPPQKVAPMIPATNGTTAATQNLTPQITQALVPFKTTVSSPATSTTQTSVAGSTRLTANQKNPALWTASVTTSPAVVMPMSRNLPRFNVPENAAPQSSSAHSTQKASLGVPVVSLQSKEVSSFKHQQTPLLKTVDSKLSQPNGTITKPILTRDEMLPPKTTLPPPLTSLPTSPHESPATENVAPSHKPPNVMAVNAPVKTPQHFDKSLTNSQTKKTITKLLSTSTSPTPSAATSFLKHVYSCPDSLKR